jgi:predicted nucleic acid-binding protein
VEPEVLVCDTTFFSLAGAAAAKPDWTQHWAEEVVARINRAVLAISVITIAEVRAGCIQAKWSRARRQREEDRMKSLARLPLDDEVLEMWAGLRASTRSVGTTCQDNDLWIAATAKSRELPVISCDLDFQRLEEHGVQVIYLPRKPDSK